jgi:serine/threonine protein kinase
MGEVYRALDTRLDRTVAIKIIRTGSEADHDLRSRLLREARAISQLQHPHICSLYDIGEHDGTNFLVMEYLEGETLQHRLQGGPLAVDQIVRIGSEIAEALAKAHRAGLVHRDLKPANIMLTRSGVKLLDFGLAKAISFPVADTNAPLLSAALTRSTATSPLTTQGTVMGTIQ